MNVGKLLSTNKEVVWNSNSVISNANDTRVSSEEVSFKDWISFMLQFKCSQNVSISSLILCKASFNRSVGKVNFTLIVICVSQSNHKDFCLSSNTCWWGKYQLHSCSNTNSSTSKSCANCSQSSISFNDTKLSIKSIA